jgi:hypothetical protein
VVDALVWGFHRRVDADSADHAPGPAGLRDGRRPGALGRGLSRAAHSDRRRLSARCSRGDDGRLLARRGAGVHTNERPDHRFRAARAGRAAAAISETGSELGGALGIAVLGSIGTALYRGQVDDGIPEGVPPDQATAARDTLGGAVAASKELSAPLADELLDAARDAFTLGMQVTALASAAIPAATAVLVVAFLRHVRAGSDEERPREVEPGIPPVPAAELE